MREETLWQYMTADDKGNDSTPNEVWMVERELNHHYLMESDFSHERLGNGPGKLLIVGSPIFEVKEFIESGWDVTYIDVRVPPKLNCTVLRQDICTSEFEPIYDAASSTCVLCHVGMGRYGDPVIEDADEKALKNICKALKPGAKAAITFGPTASILRPARLSNTHRIYNYETICNMSFQAGFEILNIKILDGAPEIPVWIPILPILDTSSVIDRHMASVLLRKHA